MDTTSHGFTQAQLASTASYHAKNLEGIHLENNDLSEWDFSGQNLTNAQLHSSTLTNASLTGANLTGASLQNSTLTNADLTGAVVTGTNFRDTTSRGFTHSQLASTVSYQAKDLQGIQLMVNDLTNWDFTGQNLTEAQLYSSTLTNANLTGATVRGALLDSLTAKGFTASQLYSTASYQSKDLTGTVLSGNDLTGWDLSGQDLTGANFYAANLTNGNLEGANLTGAYFTQTSLNNANLSGAIVSGASFSPRGLQKEQLYSTASYLAKDLKGIELFSDLTDWDFRGQDLSHATLGSESFAGTNFAGATLDRAVFGPQGTDLQGGDFSRASLRYADLRRANLTQVNFSGTDLFGADLRDSTGFNPDESTLVRNTILPNGEIRRLDVRPGEVFEFDTRWQPCIGDCFYSTPVTVTSAASISDGAVLEFVVYGFKQSIMSTPMRFDPSTSLSLDGTLKVSIPRELTHDDVGLNLDLFDWPGQLDAGSRFDQIEFSHGGFWDLSRLYTTGEVTFLSDVLGDCTGDSILNASDLSCVSTLDTRDAVLDALRTLPGDLDGNRQVNFADFLVLTGNFGNGIGKYSEGNVDLVGGVAFPDFLILADNFGKSLEAQAVPEPSGVGLTFVAIAGLAMSYKRRALKR